MDPRSLAPHPLNARRHGSVQRAAYAELLDEVGWLDALKYNRRTGRLLDGHMRREDAIERNLEAVPVLVFDLPAEQEPTVLYFLDRIGALADQDAAKEAELRALIETEQETLATLLAGVTPELDESEAGTPEADDRQQIGLAPGEAFNYVVLLFRSELDWQVAQTHFGLERVQDPFRTEKAAVGIGRVLDGGAYLERITGVRP